jgi:sugar/nucleoside kinase (ribokinase family)
MNKKILGIGNAIVDVLAKVDNDFLIKRNLTKGSMKLINTSEFEDLKKNIKIEKIVAGGSVANTMSGIAYLNGDPSFIGKINSDNFGDIYKKSLEDINVKFSYIKKNEAFTNRRFCHLNYSRFGKNYVYLSWNIITSFSKTT